MGNVTIRPRPRPDSNQSYGFILERARTTDVVDVLLIRLAFGICSVRLPAPSSCRTSFLCLTCYPACPCTAKSCYVSLCDVTVAEMPTIGNPDRSGQSLAERLRRKAHGHHSPRVFGSCDRAERVSPAQHPEDLLWVLPWHQDALVLGQGRARFQGHTAGAHGPGGRDCRGRRSTPQV